MIYFLGQYDIHVKEQLERWLYLDFGHHWGNGTQYLWAASKKQLFANTIRPHLVNIFQRSHDTPPGVSVVSRHKPFGKSASYDITGGRVHLDVCWDGSVHQPYPVGP